MAEFDEYLIYDVDQLLTEEELAELYFDVEEEMQDEDIEQYDSENENMQQEDDTENGTHVSEPEAEVQGMQDDQQGTQSINRKQLTMQQRRQIVDAMLCKMQDGNLPRGYKVQLSIQFHVHKSTITRIFTEIKK